MRQFHYTNNDLKIITLSRIACLSLSWTGWGKNYLLAWKVLRYLILYPMIEKSWVRAEPEFRILLPPDPWVLRQPWFRLWRHWPLLLGPSDGHRIPEVFPGRYRRRGEGRLTWTSRNVPQTCKVLHFCKKKPPYTLLNPFIIFLLELPRS